MNRRARNLVALSFLPMFVSAVCSADAKIKSSDGLIQIREGTMPLILSAPHGGRKPIPGVPRRTGEGIQKFTVVRDENTAELTEALAAEFEKRTKRKPWVIIAHFERKFLDVNRAADSAYESPKAKPYYDAYHAALVNACRTLKEKYGRGLLCDIHGQAQVPDAILRGTKDGKTVALLRERYGREALVGPNSLFGRIAAAGFRIEPAVESDVRENPSLNGGYIVNTYGSHQAYAIDAIQIEIGSKYRTGPEFEKTAKAMAGAFKEYCDKYFPEVAVK